MHRTAVRLPVTGAYSSTQRCVGRTLYRHCGQGQEKGTGQRLWRPPLDHAKGLSKSLKPAAADGSINEHVTLFSESVVHHHDVAHDVPNPNLSEPLPVNMCTDKLEYLVEAGR